MITPDTTLVELAQKTQQAARQLGGLTSEQKNLALEAIAQSLETSAAAIIAANQADCQAAEQSGLAKPLYHRLQLDQTKLNANILGVREVKKLPDPVGKIDIHRELDENLILKRISCPLGVLGVIFEARPEAAIQISTLAIKSGNGVILKGGKEALLSCEAIVKAIRQGLSQTEVSPDVVQLLTTREETLALLNLDPYLDLIIPRGSNNFVRFVQENTKIPVLGHAEGICHLYLDREANSEKAVAIAVDAKTQYPAACNAIETLLVHADCATRILPAVAAALQAKGVKLLGDSATCHLLSIPAATEADWSTEYSDLILSIKQVQNIEEAIAHIHTYGSKHTEAIVTEDPQAAQIFLTQVNAAGVYHNCSTRFADGFRYGFGAEVGISTQQMPPRGPVGLEGLVTYKYQITGNGHLVATYTGQKAKPFSHKDL